MSTITLPIMIGVAYAASTALYGAFASTAQGVVAKPG